MAGTAARGASGTRRALAATMRFLLLVPLLSGCVPTLHFRTTRSTYDPIPDTCVRVERCDYADPRAQARCEMAELSVPEAGALVECTEITAGG